MQQGTQDTAVSTLVIPRSITPQTSTLSAALAYAKAGWYVMPIEPGDKRPARILGNHWQHATSRDPEVIVDWFAGTSYGVGLHAGRSGALVIDLDHPDKIPPVLERVLADHAPPFQSTRTDELNHGHVIFAQPPGRMLGNGRGELRSPDGSYGWGEIRGLNGYIVACPTEHVEPNGRYEWVLSEDGDHVVPVLPEAIAALLPDAEEVADSATDEQVRAFIAAHAGATKPHLLRHVMEKFAAEAASSSRHEALVKHLAWAMRDARQGFYPAQVAIEEMWSAFEALMAGERHPATEFRGVLAWAVPQAMLIDPAARAAAVEARLDARKGASLPVPASPPAFEVTAEPDPEAPVPPAPAPARRPPADYFWDKSAGVDMEMLGQDVLAMGPLAWGKDGQFWRYEGGVWRASEEEVQGRCVDLLRGRYRNAHATNAEAYVRRYVPRLTFDPVPEWINFTNGLLDWRTGRLLEHDPGVRTTIQLPLAWDSSATCPHFEAFLASVLAPEAVALVWEMIGYLMYAGNPLQVAFLFYGSGQNGKGTLLRVIESLLGRQNVATISLDDLNGDRFAPSGLFGKIANIAGDIDATFQEQTAQFKKLTGEDNFRGQHKYGKPFDFESWAVPVFSANKIPGSADVTEGYTRRWVIVPFDVHVREEDKILGLSDLLAQELAGIAAKAVAALPGLLARKKFEQRGVIALAHEAFAEHIDRVRQWVGECTEPAEGNREPRSAVYQSFKVWAESQGTKGMSARELADRLDALGYKKKRVQGIDHIADLRVRQLRMLGEQYVTPTDPLGDGGDEDLTRD